MVVVYVLGALGSGILAAITAALLSASLYQVLLAYVGGGTAFMFFMAVYLGYNPQRSKRRGLRGVQSFQGFELKRGREYQFKADAKLKMRETQAEDRPDGEVLVPSVASHREKSP